jgi:hypothetical protein|nr:MAG: hypothetical protein [uncultured cyanophage]
MNTMQYSLFEIENATKAFDKLIEEGKDPNNYYFLDSGDMLTSNKLWDKSKGQPPNKMRSGLPDEPGLYGCTVIDLAEIPILRQWIPQGSHGTLQVQQSHFAGIFSAANALKAIEAFAQERGLKVKSHAVGQDVDAEWCPPRVKARLVKNGIQVTVICAADMVVLCADGYARDLLEDIMAGAPLTADHVYTGSDGRQQKDIGFKLPWDGGMITINRGAGWASLILAAKNGKAPYGFPGTAQEFLDIALG